MYDGSSMHVYFNPVMWILGSVMLLIVISIGSLFALYLYMWLERTIDVCASYYDRFTCHIKSCLDDTYMHFSLIGLRETEDRYLKDVEDKIDELARELIKAMYCRDILRLQMYEENRFQRKIRILEDLESLHPEFRKSYSPTNHSAFCADKAVAAYGPNDWFTVVRTLELIKPEILLRKKDELKEPDYTDFGGKLPYSEGYPEG